MSPHHLKRPIYVKRDTNLWKETYTHKKRRIRRRMLDIYHPLHTYDDITASPKETYTHGKRPIHMKRDVKKRRMLDIYHPLHTYDTYHRMKRDLYTCKETNTHENRRMKATHVAYIWCIATHHLKRLHSHIYKCTYHRMKRDLYTWKETNTHENRRMKAI